MDALAALPSPTDLFEFHSTRIALGELMLLAVAGGVTGAFVVMRRLAFFSHAVGTATFPGVVAAEAASLSPRLAALVTAMAYAGATERAGRGNREAIDAATALVLVAALAGGVVLASDVFQSGASVDRVLFGSSVALNGSDLLFATLAAGISLAAALLLGRAWAAAAFDPASASQLGLPLARIELGLLALVAVVAAAALPAVGALLVTSMLVVPSAIARLLTTSVRGLLAASVAVAGAQAVVGLYLSLWLDVPPGPAVAVVGACGYGLCAVGPHLRPAAVAPEAA